MRQAPCLFDVLADEREERRLPVADHAPLVAALLRALHESTGFAPTDPYYPRHIQCPDLPMYASRGYVRRPVDEWTAPPFPPLPPLLAPSPPPPPPPPALPTCASPTTLASACELGEADDGRRCVCRYRWASVGGRECPVGVHVHCE